MNSKSIKILLIEDNPGDARLIQEMLAEGKGWSGALECVENLAAGLLRITQGGIDVVLLDLGLPDSAGLDTLRRLRAGASQAPVVVVMSGINDEEVGMQAVQEGAQDYLVKGQVSSGLLIRSIRYAIERNEAEKALRQARDELDRQVRERTASLTQAIESLEKENAERRLAEERQKLAAQILELLNQPDEKTDVIRDILLLIHKFTGFEAVGIRLQEGEDFPYYETIGFPAHFVEAERYLCARNQDGEIMRDPTGNPLLECMCGNIICGRTDPSLPFFTKGGSFWSNGTTDLLASTTENERQAHTRNRCNSAGYESVALIPLHSGDTTIGLLQFNDRRKGMFTPEMIHYFEGIGASIGISLERKTTEEALRRLNTELDRRVLERTAQLEAANKELEAFAYSVSHDLRAPLRHIDGFLELLQQHAAAAIDPQSQHYMDTIADAARRMGALIDDLLSFSRMGRTDMATRSVELAPLVREVIRELEPERRGRTIHWQIVDLPVVMGDRAMLRVVFVNLLGNAVKFTRPRAQAEIEIGCLPGNDAETIVYVRDNGVGFDMQYADKLFGVFQRLHHVDEFEGTGIGLANVRRIIVRHGGRIWAEGQVDQGATFYFALPILK